MTDPEQQHPPDEWDPPRLSTNYPIFAPLGIGFKDGAVLFLLTIYAWIVWRGYHALAGFPSWYVPVWVSVLGLYLLHAIIRPGKRRLFAWLWPWTRHLLLVLLAPLAWGTTPYRSVVRRVHQGGVRGRLAVLLPPRLGQVFHADLEVDADGVLDTSGVLGPRWLRWLLAASRGREPLVALLRLSESGSLDLLDPEDRVGVWADRLALLRDPGHSLSLYIQMRPFPPELLAQAAGPVADEACELAEGLVRRQLLMAVPAGTHRVLHRRLRALLGSEAQPGLLAQAALAGERLGHAEVEALLDDAYGPRGADGRRSPSLTLSPRRFLIETGTDDPPPLTEDGPAPAPHGVRSYRTLVATDLPSRLAVGWTWPVTGGRVLADVAIHLRIVPHWYADAWLQFKASWWNGLKLGARRYARAAAQAERTLDLLRHRETSVWDAGVYVSVAETQGPDAEQAMETMLGRRNFSVPLLFQREGRQATEPFGRDPLGMRFWTDSHTIAAAWPSAGGIWVPGCTLLGVCARSPEPVGWNPWWEGDETSVGCILGRTGSGKTNTEMALVGRMLRPHPDHVLARRPPPAVVAYYKPYDEWAPFCQRFGGEHYRVLDGTWREVLDAAPIGTLPIVAFNLTRLSRGAQTDFLRQLSDQVMEFQERKEFTEWLLYVVGEAWLMAKTEAGAEHLQQMALQVRTLGIGLLVDSQYPDHMTRSDARDVIRSASMVTLMRLNVSERRELGELLGLSPTAARWLAQIAQPQTLEGGQATVKGLGLIRAHGLLTTVQVTRLGFERELLDQTNPRLRKRGDQTNGHHPDAAAARAAGRVPVRAGGLAELSAHGG